MPYRQPSFDEAVSIIMQSKTKEYRNLCTTYWREKYGIEFADNVAEQVKKKWANKYLQNNC